MPQVRRTARPDELLRSDVQALQPVHVRALPPVPHAAGVVLLLVAGRETERLARRAAAGDLAAADRLAMILRARVREPGACQHLAEWLHDLRLERIEHFRHLCDEDSHCGRVEWCRNCGAFRTSNAERTSFGPWVLPWSQGDASGRQE